MNTPEKMATGTTINEKIRGGLTRPGLVFAAAVIGFGLAGAAAADPAAAAQPGAHGPAMTPVAGISDAQSRIRLDGDDQAKLGDREGDKRSGDDRPGDGQDKRDRDKGRDGKDREGRDGKGRPAWVSPMPTAKTTSCFGPRWGTQHKGLDLGAPENSPVHAAGAGTVVAAGWLYRGYGISVVVDHGDGHLTHYAHLNRSTVKGGDRVKPGDRIGFEGNTGDSTGPHLHFEVHKGMWKQVNPGPWMKARGVDLKC